MISSQPDSQSASFAPDLTPLLDIIFIVMVFLLLTTNIQIQTMNIAVPQTQDEEVLASPDQEVIAINILNASPSWAIQGKPAADWQSFTQSLLTLIRSQPETPIVIAADKNASVENMLKVLAFMQKNQINATNIMMEQE